MKDFLLPKSFNLSEYWQDLTNLGEEKFPDRESKKANRLANQTLVFFLGMLIFHAVNTLFHFFFLVETANYFQFIIPVGTTIVGAYLIVRLSLFWKNKTGSLTALMFAYEICFLLLLGFALLLGRQVDAHLLLLIFLPLPLFFLGMFPRWLIVLAEIQIAAALLFCFFFFRNTEPIIPLSPLSKTVANIEVYIALVFVNSMTIYYLWKTGGARVERVTSHIEGVDAKNLAKKLDGMMREKRLYEDETLTVEQVATALNLREYQLSEFLNSHLRTGFARWVNTYRIDRAREILIEEPGANILSTAYRVGFNSKTAFNRWFRQLVGMTPREFRNQQKDKTK